MRDRFDPIIPLALKWDLNHDLSNTLGLTSIESIS